MMQKKYDSEACFWETSLRLIKKQQIRNINYRFWICYDVSNLKRIVAVNATAEEGSR